MPSSDRNDGSEPSDSSEGSSNRDSPAGAEGGSNSNDRAAFAAEQLSGASESNVNAGSSTDKEHAPDHEDLSAGLDLGTEASSSGRDDPSPDRAIGSSTPEDLASENSPESQRPDMDSVTDDPEDRDQVESEQGPASREYIRIVPVRAELSPETVVRQLYGIHEMGSGRTLPFGLEETIPGVDKISTFEFLIHKPAGEERFNFYIGIAPADELERVESPVRTQYPGDYQFEKSSLALADQFDDTPHLCRWDGREEKHHDWMMLLSQFDDRVDRSPLSNLLESAIRTNDQWVFQAVFRPRRDYTRKARRQKRNLKMGVQTGLGMGIQVLLDKLAGVSEYEERERHRGGDPGEIGGSLSNTQGEGSRWKADRLTQIDLKQPDSTFHITLRCASPDADIVKNSMSAFNQLSGTFYHIEGEHLGRDNDEFERMLNHELTSPSSVQRVKKTKPWLVVSPEELANFITVPGIHALPKASRGASGGGPAARSPLTSPDETVFERFKHGMSIGQASTVLEDKNRNGNGFQPDYKQSALSDVDDWWREINRRQSIHLRAQDLREHLLRAATTGSGKTVATINDMLTAHAHLDGPIFLIDPSGGDMTSNYLRSHRSIFGDTDDVEYISIPGEDGEVPGLPFFDIRPLIREGYSRETAIQNTVDHYFEIMSYILGQDTLEQAFVANEILVNLIKALFDESRNEYPNPDGPSISAEGKAGGDAFAISDLLSHAANYANNAEIPDIENESIETILRRHFGKNNQQFANTTDAVLNRVTKLMERDFIWRMMDYVPEWDEDRDWYARDEPVLDLLDLFHSNKVVLIDTGNLRQESQRVFTVLFLSHLITGLKSLDTPETGDYVVNVLIEEAAPIARSELMYDELLPEGRKFDLGMDLIMQYPEQVLGEHPKRNETAYREVLNNINTKVIGNVATDDLLADALFHEALDAKEIKDRVSGLARGEFLVQLPPTGFQEQKPEILTINPHPIPPGHSESERPVRSKVGPVGRKTKNRYCISPSDIAHRIDPSVVANSDETDHQSAPSDDDTASKPPEALTDEERTFLRDVIRAWNGTLDFYRRGDPMGTREFDRRGVAPDLVEHGYLRELSLANRFTYYWPEDKTLSLFDDLEIEWGPQKGDPRESPRHKIIVALLERYYQDRGADVRTYVGTNEAKQVTFDLIARRSSSDNSPFHRVVEVETSRQDRPNTPLREEDVLSDYEKMRDFVGSIDNAKAIWVVENIDAAHHLLDILEEADHVSSRPSREVQNYNKLSEQVDSGPGLDVINGFQIVVDNVLGLDLYQGPEPTDEG